MLKNGKLLAAAAGAFDTMLTVDKNIKHQQNLDELPIAVVVMIARSNRVSDLQMLLPALDRALATLKSGMLVEIDANQTIIIAPGHSPKQA